MVQSDSLGTLHLQLFHHKMSSGCVHSCNLPPTSGSARLHSLYNYTRSNCGTDGISQLYIAMAHQERQNDGYCNESSTCTKLFTWCNPLCMQNWIQHTPLWVWQIWTRVFLVMWWLQRTPLLNITLPEVDKSYRYWHNNYIETILFSHKVKVNMSV